MHVAMVSAECAPLAKAGGLGDFVQGLSRELHARGVEVELYLPCYEQVRERCDGPLETLCERLGVPFHDDWIDCRVLVGRLDGIACYFFDPEGEQRFFSRERIYGEADDAERFAFFCRAVLEFMLQTDRHPHVLHCHDWHTALIPVLLYEHYEKLGLYRSRVCFTLHNVGYQGQVYPSVLRQVGLDPGRLMTPDRLLDPSGSALANLMKGGIVYSNFVNTVSPRYAWEVRNTEQGHGLQDLLNRYAGKFGGVLNGLDTEVWNPGGDSLIPLPFDRHNLSGKVGNRRRLRERLALREAERPILAIVTRLDWQKGVHLLRHGIEFALANGAQIALLGSALDPQIAAEFERLREDTATHPDCRITLGYDERLAHLIYAGADLILIPSIYEPCGLTQMIAMRYGTVPIVRRVGGLADTVFDANHSDRPFDERNGYVFDEPSDAALERALTRAIGLWREHPDYFSQLRCNGMCADHSWTCPAQDYLNIYSHIAAPA